MLAAVRSAAVLGINAYDITVEVHIALGLPHWTIVGLPAGAVKESRERVCSALANSGLRLPPRKVTINLAPGDTRKEGTGFDLPIALGMLVAIGHLSHESVSGVLAVGELGLDGSLRAVRGVLPVARRAALSKHRVVIVPPANVDEASLVTGARVATAATLLDLVDQLRACALVQCEARPRARRSAPTDDLADVAGQEIAKRAIEIAAAGGHNAVLVGPPGSGKTMLARRLPGILPPMSEEEALEVTAIHSVAGLLPPGEPLIAERPFRAPHHSISDAGLIGGGSSPRPGEASLAHHGVLFLDELLEFRRGTLESLRQPLEDGRIILARASGSISYPVRCALVGAMNPCPCGHAGDASHACSCSAEEVGRYRAGLSGPLMDRLDLHVQLARVELRELSAGRSAESSSDVRARVQLAHGRQAARYRLQPGVALNAHASGRWLDSHGGMDREARSLLVTASERLALSARGYHRVMRVARTIADLADADRVAREHVAEALRFRPATAEVMPIARPSAAIR